MCLHFQRESIWIRTFKLSTLTPRNKLLICWPRVRSSQEHWTQLTHLFWVSDTPNALLMPLWCTCILPFRQHVENIKRDAQLASPSKSEATPWTVSTNMKRCTRGERRRSQRRLPKPHSMEKPAAIYRFTTKRKWRPELVKFILETPRTWRCCKQHPQHGRPKVRLTPARRNLMKIHRLISPLPVMKVKTWRITSFGACAQMWVHEAIWSMFMNDCMWAAFSLGDEGEQFKRIVMNHQFLQTQKIIEAVRTRLEQLINYALELCATWLWQNWRESWNKISLMEQPIG